jgi:hypothetical protein
VAVSGGGVCGACVTRTDTRQKSVEVWRTSLLP